MPSIQNKRGTRAQINAAAAANGLKQAELYLITDEDRLAVGTSVSAYQDFAKLSEVGDFSFAMTQSGYQLTNTTAFQKIFNTSATGALTLPSGTYVFEMMLLITGMSTTTGNVTFSLTGAGNAILGASPRAIMQSIGVDNSNPGNPVALNGFMVPGSIGSITPLQIAGTGTALASRIHGAFDVVNTGTIIPSIGLITGVTTAQVTPGTYIEVRRVAPTATGSVGSWS